MQLHLLSLPREAKGAASEHLTQLLQGTNGLTRRREGKGDRTTSQVRVRARLAAYQLRMFDGVEEGGAGEYARATMKPFPSAHACGGGLGEPFLSACAVPAREAEHKQASGRCSASAEERGGGLSVLNIALGVGSKKRRVSLFMRLSRRSLTGFIILYRLLSNAREWPVCKVNETPLYR